MEIAFQPVRTSESQGMCLLAVEDRVFTLTDTFIISKHVCLSWGAGRLVAEKAGSCP